MLSRAHACTQHGIIDRTWWVLGCRHRTTKIAMTQSSLVVTRGRQKKFLILYRCILDSLFSCKTALAKARVPGKDFAVFLAKPQAPQAHDKRIPNGNDSCLWSVSLTMRHVFRAKLCKKQ